MYNLHFFYNCASSLLSFGVLFVSRVTAWLRTAVFFLVLTDLDIGSSSSVSSSVLSSKLSSYFIYYNKVKINAQL